MASSSSSRRSRAPRNPVFRTSIESLFKTWTALKLAVDHGQGGGKGNEIAAWMVGAVEDYFYLNDDLMSSEVAEFLGTLMNQELDTIADDNSLEEVGTELCKYFQLCRDGKDAELSQELEKINQNQTQITKSAAAESKSFTDNSHSSSSENESEESDQEQQGMMDTG